MKLPVSWLKNYITPVPPSEKLAEIFTLSGTAVDRVENKNGEAVLEIEVTTNRPDCLSVLGLAREFSALSGAKVRLPKVSTEKKSKISKKTSLFHVEILDKKVCPFYTARLLRNISAGSTPSFAQQWINLAGARPLGSVVDATNFVLFETGQPLHAFDADQVRGEVLIVRWAKKEEKFLGIDGNEYILDEKTLVIADAERAIAIAGVMGGRLTEITPSTKNVLLESAYFDPTSVRHAAKRYKVSTESSTRFERGVDIEKVLSASARAKDLILEWAGGEEVEIHSVGSAKIKKKNILLRLSRIQWLLGVKVSGPRVVSILKNLGFNAKASGKNKVFVDFWNVRRDVTQETDLIEEILRIEGFDKIPSKIPITRYASGPALSSKASQVFGLKKFLAALGFNEIVTYSLLSKKSLEDSGHDLSGGSAHRIVNAPSAEQEYFRPNLFAGMLGAVSFNLHRKAASVRFFEVGNGYTSGKEETLFAVCLCGPLEENWLRKNDATFYDLKGVAETIAHFLGVGPCQWRPSAPNAFFDQHSELRVGQKRIGGLGRVSSGVLHRWDIAKDVFYFQCSLDSVFGFEAAKTVRVKPIPKFPFVRRDIAFVIDEQVGVGSLEESMKNAAAPYLSQIRLFDKFTGKNIPQGKRSLAFSLEYQKEDGTFTDQEIQSLQAKVGEALTREYGVQFR